MLPVQEAGVQSLVRGFNPTCLSEDRCSEENRKNLDGHRKRPDGSRRGLVVIRKAHANGHSAGIMEGVQIRLRVWIRSTSRVSCGLEQPASPVVNERVDQMASGQGLLGM